MLAEKQTECTRSEPKKPGGPHTPEGKRISSQNSFKTGLYARSLIIQGEKREDFETLQNEYYTHYQPQSPAERDLLDTMIRLVWQRRRYAHVEAELWDFEVYEQTSRGSISRHYPLGDMFAECGDKFSRLQRMQNAAQAKFKDALHELRRLQADRSEEAGQAVAPADAGEARTPVAPVDAPVAPAVLPPVSPYPTENIATSPDAEFVPSTQVEEAFPSAPVSRLRASTSWFDPSTIWSHPVSDTNELPGHDHPQSLPGTSNA